MLTINNWVMNLNFHSNKTVDERERYQRQYLKCSSRSQQKTYSNLCVSGVKTSSIVGVQFDLHHDLNMSELIQCLHLVSESCYCRKHQEFLQVYLQLYSTTEHTSVKRKHKITSWSYIPKSPTITSCCLTETSTLQSTQCRTS